MLYYTLRVRVSVVRKILKINHKDFVFWGEFKFNNACYSRVNIRKSSSLKDISFLFLFWTLEIKIGKTFSIGTYIMYSSSERVIDRERKLWILDNFLHTYIENTLSVIFLGLLYFFFFLFSVLLLILPLTWKKKMKLLYGKWPRRLCMLWTKRSFTNRVEIKLRTI